MSQPSYRERFLTDLEGLLAAGGRGTPSGKLLASVGRVARVACGDDDEGLGLPERAEALLDRARVALANASLGVDAASAEAGSFGRWLASPRGPFSAALTELDGLGAIAAGLAELSPEAPATRSLAARIDELAHQIRERARSERRPMFEAAMAASALVAERGVHPEHDAALLALADVVGLQLAAALEGEPLDDEAWKVRATEPSVAERLGALLARALERPSPLSVAPDMVELAAHRWHHAPASVGDLVLHENAPETSARAERVEILPHLAASARRRARGRDPPRLARALPAHAHQRRARRTLLLAGGQPGRPARLLAHPGGRGLRPGGGRAGGAAAPPRRGLRSAPG
ncbi:MAG: hypothetical protein MUF34_35285 [Polyangiaceae bacterium]|nr:hypothetical protein [Polyangiaceae bacterium]